MSHLRHTMSTLTPIYASIFVKLGARQVTACPRILQQCRSLPLVHDSGPVSLVQWRTLTSRPHPTIDKVIRVDHAGEFGANRIYAGQVAVLGTTEVGDVIKHMWDQEKEHLDLFRNFVGERRVRPTLLLPVWDLAGYALGAGTALLGKEAAMACTVAVEEAITEHYNSQLRELLKDNLGDEELLQGISKCRDDEMEHRDIGIKHDAEQAPAYKAMSDLIKNGCRVAIWLSERI